MKGTPEKLYGVVALAEMVTWTGLIAGLIARYGFAYDGPLFFVAGMSHGVVFLAYCAVAVIVGMNQRWSVGLGILAVATAIVPYATLPFDRWLHRSGRLAGAWRLEATDDPRDQVWLDRLFRWFLQRPGMLLMAVVVILGALLAALLWAGPPTEWGR